MLSFTHHFGYELNTTTRENLKTLWGKLYEDSRAYLDMFFDVFIDNIEVVMGTDNNDIIAIAYLVPLKISTGEKCYYFYAGGVDPSRRGQHVFSRMLDYLIDLLKGYQFLGYSVEPYLIQWYKTFLFPEIYTTKEILLEKNNCSKANVNASISKRSAAVDEIKNMRQAFIKSIDLDYIEYPDWFYNLLKTEKTFCHDAFDIVNINDGNYYIIGRIDNDSLLVDETNIGYYLMFQFGSTICDLYHVNHIKIQLPPSAETDDESPSTYSGQGTFTENLWAPFMLL